MHHVTRFRRDPLTCLALWACAVAFAAGLLIGIATAGAALDNPCATAGDPIACLIVTAR